MNDTTITLNDDLDFIATTDPHFFGALGRMLEYRKSIAADGVHLDVEQIVEDVRSHPLLGVMFANVAAWRLIVAPSFPTDWPDSTGRWRL